MGPGRHGSNQVLAFFFYLLLPPHFVVAVSEVQRTIRTPTWGHSTAHFCSERIVVRVTPGFVGDVEWSCLCAHVGVFGRGSDGSEGAAVAFRSGATCEPQQRFIFLVRRPFKVTCLLQFFVDVCARVVSPHTRRCSRYG